MKWMIYAAQIALLQTMALYGVSYAAGSADVCKIGFDGHLKTSREQEPSEAKGIAFGPGKIGQGVVIRTGTQLSYSTARNYDSRRGTVEFWVKPNWDSNKAIGDKAFWVIDDDPGKENRTVIGFYGDGGTGKVYFSGRGGVDGITTPVNWKAGEWRHLVACWDEKAHQKGLFIDGENRGIVGYVQSMPSQQAAFHIGFIPAGDSRRGGSYYADAAIDEFSISGEVHVPDFLRVTAGRKAYHDAFERLHRDFSLDRVARDKAEVDWNDVKGMATPLSYRVPVQPMHHPDTVLVHPDMAVTLGSAPDSLGLGFAIGSPLQLPDMWKVTRKLNNGYQPIVESKWRSGGVVLSQTVLGVLPHDERVVTGKETQYVVIRLTVSNPGLSLIKVPLSVLVGKMTGSQNACYEAYTTPISRWQSAALGVSADDKAVSVGGRTIFTFRCSAPTPSTFHPAISSVDPNGKLVQLNNCLTFDIELGPKEKQTVDLIVAGNSRLYGADEKVLMEKVTFDWAFRRASAHWESGLLPAMKLVTPDSRINRIYKALVLSNLSMFVKPADDTWMVPYQMTLGGTWSWEFAHMATPMMAIGYHRELEPVLKYFTDRQNGVGPRSADVPPSGDVKSTKGSYVGTVMFWMNETGSVLWAMAQQYRYSHDIEWLKANKASILAAWEWIQSEREATRVMDSGGKKVAYFGLMPAGTPDDSGGKVYHMTITDNFTWFGMSEIAKAFHEAGFPEADRLTQDSDEYRQCILDAIAREKLVDPETGLPFIPNEIGAKPNRATWWMANGPIQLFDTGLLSPNDSYFEPMVQYTKRKYGILMGMAEHCAGGVEWYPNQTERAFYKVYLARGETEKAMLVLYCNLTYGMSNDTLQTCERFHMDDPNFSPLQANGSGNGRDIDMLRRMVIDEQDADQGRLWLLRGCPRRWFTKGKSITVENAPTLFGKMALKSISSGDKVTVDIECPDREPIKEIRLVAPRPDRKPIASAIVNGKPAKTAGDTVIITEPRGRLHVECRY